MPITVYASRGRIRLRRAGAAGLLAAVGVTAAAALGHPPPSVRPASTAAHRAPGSGPPGALGEADGAVPAGTTVFDDGVPGVAKLSPGLLAALRRAATDAARDGVTLQVDSGWRSRAYQRQLLRDAIAKYGSAAEAARWVASPGRSAHVSGDAVDVGPASAAAWLGSRGAGYGLCRVYANEPWHYELRPDAGAQGCPATYADPTHDPRIQTP